MQEDWDLCGRFNVKFMMRKVNRPVGAGGAKTQEGKIEAEPAGRHQALINSTNNALIKPACSILIFFFWFVFFTSK